jgi:hypothetical protein
VAQLYSQALGSLSVAFYDSQDYGGSMLARLHSGGKMGHADRIKAFPLTECIFNRAEILFFRTGHRLNR